MASSVGHTLNGRPLSMALSVASTHLDHPEGAPEDHASDSDSDTDEAESPGGVRNPSELEAERLRVLEAAGLLVRDEEGEGGTKEAGAGGGVGRRGTVRRRRPAPARPSRRAPVLPETIEDGEGKDGVKEVGEVVAEDGQDGDETEDVIDDAYDVSCPSQLSEERRR